MAVYSYTLPRQYRQLISASLKAYGTCCNKFRCIPKRSKLSTNSKKETVNETQAYEALNQVIFDQRQYLRRIRTTPKRITRHTLNLPFNIRSPFDDNGLQSNKKHSSLVHGMLLKDDRAHLENCPDTPKPKRKKGCTKWPFKILPDYNIKEKQKEVEERKRREKGLPRNCECGSIGMKTNYEDGAERVPAQQDEADSVQLL